LRRSDFTDNTRRAKHGRTRFWVLTAIGAIVAIVVLAIVVDAAVYNNKIHAGVSIAGQAVGGSTRAEATAQLTKVVEQTQNSTVTLTNGGKTWDLLPADVGTKFDIEGAVSAAMADSRDGNFFSDLGHRLKLYFSGVDVPLTGTVDSAMMDKYLNDLATQLDVAAVDASLTFEAGAVKVVGGTSGTAVDKEKLRVDLESLLLAQHTTELVIPMKEQQPAVKAEDMQAAVDHGRALLSAPVTLTFKDKSWSITTSQIGSFMDFTTQDVNGVSMMEPYLSAAKMTAFFASIAADVATDPVDATFKSDGTKAWVVPAVPGTKLDPEKTAEAVTAAALETTARTVEVAVTTAEPKLTTAAAEAMGIKDKLSSYTTPPYSGSGNRQVNVRITTQYASDRFLAPGEEYDFDKQIGPRTVARGYKTAPGIVGNGELEDVLGGGICQVSTTLFNAVFEAGLQVVERHNHSLYISHYPAGRDATVAGGGGKNFRFKNDTANYIWIRGTSDGVTTTFNIYGTDDGRKVKWSFSGFSYGASRTTVTILSPSLKPGATHVKISGQSGRSCSERRTVTYADGTTHTDVFESYYPMIPQTIEVGPTTTTTTLPGSTTTTTGDPTSTTAF
jgi:vancomycin resistance protein YoaR